MSILPMFRFLCLANYQASFMRSKHEFMYKKNRNFLSNGYKWSHLHSLAQTCAVPTAHWEH